MAWALRPSLDKSKYDIKMEYLLEFSIVKDTERIEETIKIESIFVVSTKTDMSASDILREYQIQSAVERKFQFLKSPKFISSFYLNFLK